MVGGSQHSSPTLQVSRRAWTYDTAVGTDVSSGSKNQRPRVPRRTSPFVRGEPDQDAHRVSRWGPIDMDRTAGHEPCAGDGDEAPRDGHAAIRSPVEVSDSEEGPDDSTVIVGLWVPGSLRARAMSTAATVASHARKVRVRLDGNAPHSGLQAAALAQIRSLTMV